MSPELESHIRNLRGPLMILLGLVVLCVWLFTDDFVERYVAQEPVERVQAPADEWLYVKTNNVLFFMVDDGVCRTERKYSLLQVHKDTKVLVISRQGEWTEVELEDQTKLFTHGCIHETMLEKRDD